MPPKPKVKRKDPGLERMGRALQWGGRIKKMGPELAVDLTEL
jgi:hypothetical protein